MHKIFLFLATIAASLGAPALAQNSGPDAPRVVAVGDLHGDYDAWLAIARAAGLADEDGDWAAGETVLVQLGDVTDRGPDSLKIIRHLQELDEEAEAVGGDVIVLMGNHESMNVVGDLRYVHPGEYEAFRDRSSEARREATWRANQERLEAFYRGKDPELTSEQIKQMWFAETPLGKLEHRRAWIRGGELGGWAAELPAIAKIGSTLFVHGGLSEETTREPIETINERHRAALQPANEIDFSVLYDPLGPLWYRGNVRREAPPEPEETDPSEADPSEEAEQDGEAEEPPAAIRPTREEELCLVLSRYDAERLVVAHTPSLSGIETDLDGRLVRIDTGISSHYGGPASYLVIEGGRVVAHQRLPDGTWSSRSLDLAAQTELQ